MSKIESTLKQLDDLRVFYLRLRTRGGQQTGDGNSVKPTGEKRTP